MLSDLKFVQGAVAKKDFMPALTHFCVEDGTVRGYNGTIALCSPIPFDIACKPKAEPLVRAIANCGETIALSLTPAGRLSIKSGSFKAFVDCISGETPHVQPEGAKTAIDGAPLLAGLKAVNAFMSDDASRPWANGVLFRGTSMFATNNVTLVEFWSGVELPGTFNIPRLAVREMLRIDEAPEAVQATNASLTFHYSGDRWLRTQLLSNEWPDLSRVLDVTSCQLPIPDGLFEALAKLRPFADKLQRVYLRDGLMRTHETDNEGAAVELEGLVGPGVFNIEMLSLLEGVANTVDFSSYPRPCIFVGERLRGAIIGMKA